MQEELNDALDDLLRECTDSWESMSDTDGFRAYTLKKAVARLERIREGRKIALPTTKGEPFGATRRRDYYMQLCEMAQKGIKGGAEEMSFLSCLSAYVDSYFSDHGPSVRFPPKQDEGEKA